MKTEGINVVVQSFPTQQSGNHDSKEMFSNVLSSLLTTSDTAENKMDNPLRQNEISLTDDELIGLHTLLNDKEIVQFLNLLLANQEDHSFKVEEQIELEDLASLLQEDGSNRATNNESLLLILTQFLSIFKDYDSEPSSGSMNENIKMFNIPESGIEQKNLLSLLQKVNERVEVLLKQKESLNRSEYLNRVFSTVVKDANEQNSNLKKSFTSMVSNDPFLQQKLMNQNQITLIQGQSNKPISTEQLIHQFEAILAKSQFVNQGPNGVQKLLVKLYPEHLGSLRIELIQKESGLVARFLTTTMSAKEILESQLQNLRQAFHVQNIQIDRLEVSSQLNFQERFNPRDSQQQQEQRQQGQGENGQDHQTSQESFAGVLINEEI